MSVSGPSCHPPPRPTSLESGPGVVDRTRDGTWTDAEIRSRTERDSELRSGNCSDREGPGSGTGARTAPESYTEETHIQGPRNTEEEI